MEFLPEYGLALLSGTVALFRRANGALVAFFAHAAAAGLVISGNGDALLIAAGCFDRAGRDFEVDAAE